MYGPWNNITQNQLQFSYKIIGQYCLGPDKLLDLPEIPFKKLLWNFKIYLMEFFTNWLTAWLTDTFRQMLQAWCFTVWRHFSPRCAFWHTTVCTVHRLTSNPLCTDDFLCANWYFCIYHSGYLDNGGAFWLDFDSYCCVTSWT